MKKFLFTLFTLAFATGISIAGVVEKSYQFENPKISQTDGYQIISFENALLTGVAGEPALPYFSVSLILPPGEAASNIEIIPGEEVLLEGTYQLYPMQHSQPVSKGKSGTFAFNEQVYQSNAVYPAEHEKDTTLQTLTSKQ